MRRKTRAKRQHWRRMDVRSRPIRLWELLALCLGTVLVAEGILTLFTAHQPALKLLGRGLPGVALLFAVLLAIGFAVLFRGWLGRNVLAIPVGALLSYAAAPIAFHVYFGLFEFATWRQLLGGSGPWIAIVLTVAVWPSYLLAWLFAAVAAALFLAASAVLELMGIAVTTADVADIEAFDQGSDSPSEDSTREAAGRDATRSDNRAQAG